MAVLTPITLPWVLMSGPPEFPGLIAASVCMIFGILNDDPIPGFCSFPFDGKSLPKPLTIPTVIEPESPNGFPIATTVSPILNEEELAKGSGANLSEEIFFTFMTAKSSN
jgi:hypothetical protein